MRTNIIHLLFASFLIFTDCRTPPPLDSGVQERAMMGADRDNRTIDFKIYMLSDRYQWVLGSTTEVERDGKQDELTEYFASSPGMSYRMKNSEGVIAVGCASNEGNLAAEQKRSQERADTLAQSIIDTLEADVPVYTLNLGQYTRDLTEDKDTGWQRRVIVISIQKKEEQANISQALQSALFGISAELDKKDLKRKMKERINDFRLDPGAYSMFVLRRR